MRQLLESTDCVLFDFDGPVCRLFVRRPTPAVAARLRALLDDRGVPLDTLGLDASDLEDPYAVLRAAAATTTAGRPRVGGRDSEEPGAASGVLTDIAQALTAEELLAVESAWPTPYADQLIQTLHATGHRLAITSDHSEAAITRYLRTRGLARLFAGHIHGRGREATRLTPDPDCVLRALESTATPPERALFIGDSPRGLATAEAAGVAFLGYARDERTEATLRAAGAEHIVTSLLEAVRVAAIPHFS